MKPNQARAIHQREQQRRATLGDALADYKGDRSVVVPDLIPNEQDLSNALRHVRKLANQTERTPMGPRRRKKLDDLMFAVARLVFLERVMELDSLVRAGLTPAALWELSKLAPGDVLARVKLLNGQAPPKPDSGLILPPGVR